ncbi:MAG: hypothetical protein JO100_18710 [Pseudonocardia sp.]|nr:hypothetical protein [Pseudonocardia sp.]
MRLPEPTALYAAQGRELAELLELVLTGSFVSDPATAERQIVRSLGALAQLHQRHRIDEHGRCSICRSAPRAWWPWPQRGECTVYATLRFYLRQPEWAVLAVITEGRSRARGA